MPEPEIIENPAEKRQLANADYPATGKDRIGRAQEDGTSRDVVDTPGNLPDTAFRLPGDSSRPAGFGAASAAPSPGEDTRETVARAGGKAPHRSRGLQAADEDTRERVARAGGKAPHEVRGLQAADEETRERVARAGGKAPHGARGLQAADPETRKRVARAGGEAPHKKRGLQAADPETRKRVARKGGETSNGGRKAA